MAIAQIKDNILKLMQGYPQDWIYIERRISQPIGSPQREGVKGPSHVIGKTVGEVLRRDILDVSTRKVASIRPIIGANGAGKSTQMEIKVKQYLEEAFPGRYIHLFFDFKYISDKEEDFWPILLQRLYTTVQERKYLQDLCNLLPKASLRSELLKHFRNTEVVSNILDAMATDEGTQQRATEYFYDASKQTKKSIQDFFYGFVKLALECDKLVVLCFDELQFLIDIDPTRALVKLVLEQFIRKIMEECRDKRLYIVVSCLQNPDKNEYDALRAISKNFDTIIAGKEIMLDQLTSSEQDEIIIQVAEKVQMAGDEKRKFTSQVKSKLDFYFPRMLLSGIASILDTMGYTAYSVDELRKLYEKEAREFIAPVLREKGFAFVDPEPCEIGGYNFDIHASLPSQRNVRVAEAFGEVTITGRASIKPKVEKFVSWLLAIKGREYKPDKGDLAFFICPSGRLTPGAKEVLQSHDITVHEFDSSLINEINQAGVDEEPPEEKPASVSGTDTGPETSAAQKPVKPAKKKVIAKKKEGFDLSDVAGIGAAKLQILKDAGITTIAELIACNVNDVAKRAKGAGVKSLNTWKQNAKHLLDQK